MYSTSTSTFTSTSTIYTSVATKSNIHLVYVDDNNAIHLRKFSISNPNLIVFDKAFDEISTSSDHKINIDHYGYIYLNYITDQSILVTIKFDQNGNILSIDHYISLSSFSVTMIDNIINIFYLVDNKLMCYVPDGIKTPYIIANIDICHISKWNYINHIFRGVSLSQSSISSFIIDTDSNYHIYHTIDKSYSNIIISEQINFACIIDKNENLISIINLNDSCKQSSIKTSFIPDNCQLYRDEQKHTILSYYNQNCIARYNLDNGSQIGEIFDKNIINIDLPWIIFSDLSVSLLDNSIWLAQGTIISLNNGQSQTVEQIQPHSITSTGFEIKSISHKVLKIPNSYLFVKKDHFKCNIPSDNVLIPINCSKINGEYTDNLTSFKCTPIQDIDVYCINVPSFSINNLLIES